MIKTQSDIIEDMIYVLRQAQPDADTKVGSVIRDFIDAVSFVVADLYTELDTVSRVQNLQKATGSDLDKLAQQFGVTRKAGRKASGTILVGFNALTSGQTIIIANGSVLETSSGVQFRIVGNYFLTYEDLSQYQSIATQYTTLMSQYSVVMPYAYTPIAIEAITTGAIGNVGIAQIKNGSLEGISTILNPNPTFGGEDPESDEELRERVALVFTGNNVGTPDYYKSIALMCGADDALVVPPTNTTFNPPTGL